MGREHLVHWSAAEGFARGAETYARGRPDFPPEAQAWLREQIGLAAGCTVVDLGAGTGKFTAELLATGARVFAVDPVAPMLDQLRLSAPGATVIVGQAESIPLADEACDAVVCAQSFHWFANKKALAEIRRVLKPGGRLGLIWNVRDESVDWVKKLTGLIDPYEGDAPRMASGKWHKRFPATGFGPLTESCFPHGHTGSPERVIVDRVASVSFIAALPVAERERVIEKVRALIAATPALAGREEVTFPYVTAAYSCVRQK